jgi:hypothetical protein
MKKSILLTFDYELFLGKKSGSVDNCLIEPTEKIRHILNKYNIKAIFFVDTTYLLRLAEVAQNNKVCKQNLTKIENQLQQLKKDGHSIFHHLHPHWLDAIYIPELDEWNLENISKYSFKNISLEERNRIFEFSDAFIRKFEGENKVGFRAGGLYVEPISDFLPYFSKYNIKYEFSICPEEYSIGKNDSYDFRHFPYKPYFFQTKVNKEELIGEYIEYPITRFKISGIPKILNGIYHRLFSKSKTIYGDGFPVNLVQIEKPENHFFELNIPLSLEFLNSFNYTLCISYLKKNDYIHFLSHPKLMSDESIDSMDKMLKVLIKKYNLNSDFRKIQIKN